jgi:hypothetical protein
MTRLRCWEGHIWLRQMRFQWSKREDAREAALTTKPRIRARISALSYLRPFWFMPRVGWLQRFTVRDNLRMQSQ